MNVKCETQRPAGETTALIADEQFSAQQLMRRLRAACRASLSPEFARSNARQQRQAARARFSPSLSFGRHFCPPLPTARPAAVMMMIEPRDGQWVLPLTVRPNHLPDHPGQVCLPGGRVEAGESILEAAEREYCEELGVDIFPGQTLGHLQSIYVYNSDYLMTPCVAISHEAHKYNPSPDEVASLVYLPLADLLDSNCYVNKRHQRGSVYWHALGIEACGVHVWGATAIVLGELAAVLG